jgi:hypothetical protein
MKRTAMKAARGKRAAGHSGGDGGLEGEGRAAGIDLDALFVALVLVPGSYPRNRFFQLYRVAAARRVRRRAALVRSLVAALSSDTVEVELSRRDALSVSRSSVEPKSGSSELGRVRLSYRVPDLGVARTTHLSEDELAVMKRAVELAGVAPPWFAEVDDAASARIEPRLLKLLGDADRWSAVEPTRVSRRRSGEGFGHKRQPSSVPPSNRHLG